MRRVMLTAIVALYFASACVAEELYFRVDAMAPLPLYDNIRNALLSGELPLPEGFKTDGKRIRPVEEGDYVAPDDAYLNDHWVMQFGVGCEFVGFTRTDRSAGLYVPVDLYNKYKGDGREYVDARFIPKEYDALRGSERGEKYPHQKLTDDEKGYTVYVDWDSEGKRYNLAGTKDRMVWMRIRTKDGKVKIILPDVVDRNQNPQKEPNQ